MKHSYLLFLFVFFLLFKLPVSNAQNKSSISEYMDDGGVSSAKHNISTNILSYTRGDIPILYEYRFAKYFSIETGVGVMLPYCLNYYVGAFSTNKSEEYAEKTLGYSLLVHPKYFVRKDLEAPAFGLLCRMRHYGEVTRFGFATTIEKRWICWNRISISFGMDLGFSYQISSSPEDPFYFEKYNTKATYPNEEYWILIGGSLKIGFIF